MGVMVGRDFGNIYMVGLVFWVGEVFCLCMVVICWIKWRLLVCIFGKLFVWCCWVIMVLEGINLLGGIFIF